MDRLLLVVLRSVSLTGFSVAFALPASADLSVEAINGAAFDPEWQADDGSSEGPNPLVIKLQILLDRANASPGVIDGYNGENVSKAISAFETVNGLTVDGNLDSEVWSALVGGGASDDVIVRYEITSADLDYPFVDRIPADYGELAEMENLNFTNLEEMLAERFHMDIDLFRRLNSDLASSPGATVAVAKVGGSPPQRKVTTIEVDKHRAQLRAYDEVGRLIVAYPATVGSNENPTPSGDHQVEAIAPDPVYYYRPSENFQQGDNSQPLNIPPGPNNPVGTVWIDLSEPGYGIHGTSEPAEIDKTASHGCVRLTNWDAEELASLVEPGVTVRFSK